MSTSKRTNLVIWIIVAIIIALPVEIGSYVVGRVLTKRQLILDEPSGSAESYQDYLDTRDPVLGWPFQRQFGKEEFAADGTRIDPRFTDIAVPSCISVFGDSFTWGDEVPPESAYPSVLAELMDCRVANFGVKGYGTDQALMRYQAEKPESPIVIFGHFADNIIRNINQLRDLIGGTQYGLKPRYVLRNESLLSVELPKLTWKQFANVYRNTAFLLPEEYFIPNSYEAASYLSFPYSLAVARSMTHYRVLAKFNSEPPYARFYKVEHPSGALAVTSAIIKEFYDLAMERGQFPVVVLIPGEADLRRLQEGGTTTYSNLEHNLAENTVIGPNIAEEMVNYLGDRDPCSLYTGCGGNHHLNPDGYSLLANIIFDWVSDANVEHLIE